MTNDNLADYLTRIKNGYLARKKEVVIPWSKTKEGLTAILIKEGYLEKSELKEHDLVVGLKYDKKKPALTDLKRISKPGLRIYAKKTKIQRVLSGLGLTILSTSKGLMTNKEAKEKNLGGELICKVW